MSSIADRGILRWKEWLPLVTQQQRLRSLIQVIAYNVQVKDEVLQKHNVKKLSYYYTLHLSTMSAPLYTSEKLDSENPKWSEVEINQQFGAAKGVVIRLWVSVNGEADYEVTIWGLHFSGLIYLGPRILNTDPSTLGINSLVFHMLGGYFTAPHCFLTPPSITPRTINLQMNYSHVKSSYSLNSLLRLQEFQQSIKRQTIATQNLREQISSGCAIESDGENSRKNRGSATLRKLMSKPPVPKVHPQKLLAIKKEIEMKKFQIQMLSEEKDREEALVHKLARLKDSLKQKNQDRRTDLMEKYSTLKKNVQIRFEAKQVLKESRLVLSKKTALLDKRKKTLMSHLSSIYPIVQLPNGNYTIRDVHLPDSEDFDGKDELMISVALGFVTHLVQMLAFFLNVPTRYPMVHFGSRSKIIDHISENFPDKDREFPLYARGKEKPLFNYGVYLLNKNIAQLRWCCGLTTKDLRSTLFNLSALLDLNSITKPHDTDSILNDWTKTWDEKPPTMSFSLDTLTDPTSSDNQEYSEKKKEADTTQVHDLASLMSLDITCKSYENLNSSNLFGKDPMTLSNQDCPTPDL